MKNKKSAKFIVIEGGDGSGKGTVIELLKGDPAYKDFVFTREPGGTEVGVEIREVLLRTRQDEISFKADMLLYLADRVEHLERVVLPALSLGKNVLSDRYEATLYAYQLYARQNEEHVEMFFELKSLLGIITPDLYIFLDQEPEISLQRANQRPDEKNRFDTKSFDFYVRARKAYLSFMRFHNSRVVYVGAVKTPERVTEEVSIIIDNFLAKSNLS